ncbi:MAG: MATE family efflux transporter [Synergistaceae bacterium]|jgi:putative MATE family efflux protein|nr:MATE family efflux transporter [Synergistaceae bacterium]
MIKNFGLAGFKFASLKRCFSKPTDLGEGPVGMTLLQMSIPAISMMLLNTLFFMVDTIFISWLGETPTASVSLTFPINITLFAFLEGVSGGTTALVGQNLGRGKPRAARKAAFSGLALGYILSACAIPMLFPGVSAAIFNRLGALGNAETLKLIYAYNMWLPLMAPFITYTFVCNSIFRCQGDTVTPMVCMAIANLINGVLDPIFIFTFGWGVGGAAAATFVGRVFAAAYIRRKMKRNPDISLPFLLPPRRAFVSHWKPISAIGFPVTLATGSIALGFGAVNRVLAAFGHHAVAAWMLAIRVEDFYFTIAMGVGSALTPFLAFNYGRRDLPRMLKGIKAAAWIAGSFMTVIGAIIFIYPHLFLGLFHPSARVMDLASRSIRVSLLVYPIVVMHFTLGSAFVATGYSLFATATQLTRSVFARIPAAYFFAWWLGERGIWWFQPFSYLLSSVVTWSCFVYMMKKIRKDFT